jgi:hypothetical protein
MMAGNVGRVGIGERVGIVESNGGEWQNGRMAEWDREGL